MPFAILGTPRSRTAWFARFLKCEHEPSRHWASLADVYAYFKPEAGASDSMLTLHWRELAKITNMRIVVIVRPLDQVVRSALNAGLTNGVGPLLRIYAAIAEIASHRAIPIVAYDALTPEKCAEIFTYLLKLPCPQDWLRMCDVPITADTEAVFRDAKVNESGLRGFYGV